MSSDQKVLANEIAIKEDPYYLAAVQHYNQGRYKEAHASLDELKKSHALDNLMGFSLEEAYLEVLINFNLGRITDDFSYFARAIIYAKGLIKNKSLTTKDKIKLITVTGESFSLMEDLPNAIRAFQHVVELDTNKENKLIWFKLFVLMSKTNLKRQAIDFGNSVLLKWPEFVVPTHFVLLDIAISFLDKTQGLKLAHELEKHISSMDLAQRERLIKAVFRNLADLPFTERLISKSREISGDSSLHSHTEAQLSFYNGHYETAIEALLSAHNGNEDLYRLSFDYSLIGRAYEKLMDYDKAYDYFLKSSQCQEERDQKVAVEMHIQPVNYPQRYKAVDLGRLAGRAKIEPGKIGPIFMLGFPRSGTTLLDTILDTQPSISTLSEQTTILGVIQAIETKLGKRYPEDLVNLQDSELYSLRELYFDKVRLCLGIDDDFDKDMIIIDKMPLNTQHIPLILLLFPEAKFIFSVRHPMDCVLSCFQQNLLFNHVFNEEMTFLSTLEKCTQKYIDVLEHFSRCQAHYSLNLHYVYYESLVSKFEEEALNVFSFIGLSDVDDSFKEFNSNKSAKLINTPSRHQVNKSMYSSSKYKWKNYQHYLNKPLERLQPYILKLGYKDDI